MTYETWQEALVLIPEHMRAGVTRYIENGVEMGGFAMAVFENDLLRACQNADWMNKQNLSSWGTFLLYCPISCYGNRQAVERWMEMRGLHGIAAKMKTQENEVG